MKKQLHKNFLQKVIAFLLILIFSSNTKAQTPTDMQFVAGGNICAGVAYSYNSWSKYWQGTELISNQNIGTVTIQKYMAGFALGITDNLNVMMKVPYALTGASGGTLNGQTDIEDFYLNVKARIAEPKLGKGKLKFTGNLGFSTPLSHYLVDFAPLNCGAGTTNLSYRQIINYQLDKGWYIGGKAMYMYRSNIPNIHRDMYYDQGAAYYTNEVFVPNIFEWMGAIGFRNEHLLAEINYIENNTLGGSDIFTWEPGFPTNNVDLTMLTGRFDYYFNKPNGLNITAAVGYTLAGRNAGQSMFASIGINYLFAIWQKKEAVK